MSIVQTRVIQLSSFSSNVTKTGMSNTLFNKQYYFSSYVQTTYKYNKSLEVDCYHDLYFTIPLNNSM